MSSGAHFLSIPNDFALFTTPQSGISDSKAGYVHLKSLASFNTNHSSETKKSAILCKITE